MKNPETNVPLLCHVGALANQVRVSWAVPSAALHPRDFRVWVLQHANQYTHFASNHASFVDLFPSDQVLVHPWSSPDKPWVLSAHPGWEKWLGVMKSGEFWSWCGEERP